MTTKLIATGRRGPLKAAKPDAVHAVLRKQAAAGRIERPDGPVPGIKTVSKSTFGRLCRRLASSARKQPMPQLESQGI